MTNLDLIRQKIREANKAYWQDSNPVITDTEYDRLVNSLKQLSPNDPLLSEIGKGRITGEKIVHKKPMLSLDKRYDWKEMVAWCSSVARSENEMFMVSPKYDGLSLEYADERISVRGDGYEGQDISHLIPFIHVVFEYSKEGDKYFTNGMSLTDYIEHSDDVYGHDRVVGELLISYHHFDKLKHLYPEIFKKYKTCRNLISGFANTKEDADLSSLYQGSHYINVATFVSHRAFEIPVSLKELKAGRNVIAEVMQFVNDPAIDFPVDGIVVRLADDPYAESLGATQHHPRGSLAYKLQTEQKQVELKKIIWQVGNERVSPKAQFDPIKMDGVMIERATLHGADFLEDNNVHVGSILTIERRGGVIPSVMDVKDDGKPFDPLPTVCPVCGAPLKRDGAYLICTGSECRGKMTNKITRGLEILGIKGVGPALAVKACEACNINNIMEWAAKLGSRDDATINWLRGLGFTDHEISVLTRISEVMANGIPLTHLLASVCIPKCAAEFAETVEFTCGGIANLMATPVVDDMYNVITDFCKSDAVANFMIWIENHREEFADYINRFKIVSVEHAPSNTVKGVVCFTGAGPMPRKDLEKFAIDHGYKCTENVGKCTILVAEDVNGSSSKLKKARAKGIRIINYDELLEL